MPTGGSQDLFVLTEGGIDRAAVLREGPNQVTGERVIVFLDEKRSVVEGGSDGRAEMVFNPKDAG